MKAIVKATGEQIDVIPNGMMRISCSSYKAENGRMIPATALEFEKHIDWEQRRYELAKAFEAASLANPEYLQYATTGRRIDTPEERLANVSIRYADALIQKLQEDGKAI